MFVGFGHLGFYAGYLYIVIAFKILLSFALTGRAVVAMYLSRRLLSTSRTFQQFNIVHNQGPIKRASKLSHDGSDFCKHGF